MGEKKVIYILTLASGTTQILISQHTHALPAEGNFLCPLLSVKWEKMNSLSLLYHLTAMAVIFWRSWTSL